VSDQDKFYAELGIRVRKARLALNLTQEQLADLVFLNRTSVTNIEKGKQKILAHTLVDLADNLQTSVSELLPEKRDKPKDVSVNALLPQDSSPEERKFLEKVLEQTKKGRAKQ
jgi:transcriptional regulator with XRE-family HTH domain